MFENVAVILVYSFTLELILLFKPIFSIEFVFFTKIIVTINY